MARITVEDCLTKVVNRFALVQLASKRTKQLLHGAKALITDRRDNKAVVTSLREIADGSVRFMTEEEEIAAAERAQQLAESKAAEAQKPQIQFTSIVNTQEAVVEPASGEAAAETVEGEESKASLNGDSAF